MSASRTPKADKDPFNAPIPCEISMFALSQLIGLESATGRDLLGKIGIIPGSKSNTRRALRAIYGELRARQDRQRNPEARNRTDEANAQKAEIETATLKGELMPAGEGLAVVRDFMTKLRQVFASATHIPAQHREWLLKKAREIKVEDGE